MFLPIIHQTVHFSTGFKVATFLGPIPLKQPSFLQTVLYRHLSYIYKAKLSFPTKWTRWNGFNRYFNESIANQLKLFRSLISNVSSVDWHSNLITFRPHCLNQFFFTLLSSLNTLGQWRFATVNADRTSIKWNEIFWHSFHEVGSFKEDLIRENSVKTNSQRENF